MTAPIRYGIAAKFRPWPAAENAMVREVIDQLQLDREAKEEHGV